MNFYLVALDRECDFPYCNSNATCEVRSSGTAAHGRFCKKHAKDRKKHLEEVYKVWGPAREMEETP